MRTSVSFMIPRVGSVSTQLGMKRQRLVNTNNFFVLAGLGSLHSLPGVAFKTSDIVEFFIQWDTISATPTNKLCSTVLLVRLIWLHSCDCLYCNDLI